LTIGSVQISFRVLRCKIAILVLSGALCSGCSQLASLTDNATKGITGAEPLISPAQGVSQKQVLLAAISDSYTKCEAYKRRLLLGSRSTNLTFDILTTIFGALGTAFTPVSTVHIFTAATTISSGSKTAIDADIYQNATAPLMVQAIASTYDGPMDTLHDNIAKASDSASEYDFGNVVRIHDKCSLTEALVQVQTLENAKAPSSTSKGASSMLDDTSIKKKAKFMLSDGSTAVVTSVKPAKMDDLLTYTLQGAAAGSIAVNQQPMKMRDFIAMLNSKGAKKVDVGGAS
jgi:hypothetical protein